MSPESYNEIIEILREHVRERIKHEIDSQKHFSVSADTTSDVNNRDEMVVEARFVTDKGFARERVIEIKVCQDKHGEKTTDYFLKSLESNDIDVNYLIFQTYDFPIQSSRLISLLILCHQRRERV